MIHPAFQPAGSLESRMSQNPPHFPSFRQETETPFPPTTNALHSTAKYSEKFPPNTVFYLEARIKRMVSKSKKKKLKLANQSNDAWPQQVKMIG